MTRLVALSNGVVLAVLTDEQEAQYTKMYLDYAWDLMEEIDEEWGESAERPILFEKMLSPFEYWLRDRIRVEQGCCVKKGA